MKPKDGSNFRQDIVTKTNVLILAGLDPTGGAGLVADIQALTDAGVHPLPLLSANTLQGPGTPAEFQVVHSHFLHRQLSLVINNLAPAAIKVGMMGTAETAQILIDAMNQKSDKIPLILDPVRSASSGGDLTRKGIRDALIMMGPQVTLITPNLPELSWLSGIKITSDNDLQRAVEKLGSFGFNSVLVKGGHNAGTPVDRLYVEGQKIWQRQGERYGYTIRGTGCRLASFIAARMALGDTLPAAVDAGYEYVQELFVMGE